MRFLFLHVSTYVTIANADGREAVKLTKQFVRSASLQSVYTMIDEPLPWETIIQPLVIAKATTDIKAYAISIWGDKNSEDANEFLLNFCKNTRKIGIASSGRLIVAKLTCSILQFRNAP